jgi:hypothetical protein
LTLTAHRSTIASMAEDSPPTPPPPGWYPDPEKTDAARYWDGVKWTERRAPLMSVQGVVERLEKSSEREMLTWRFVVRSEEDSLPVVVELQGEEIHGALSDGDEVRLIDGMPKPGTDVLTAQRVENQTLHASITVHRRSTVRRWATDYGKVAVTTVVSVLTSTTITLILTQGRTGASEDAETSEPSFADLGALAVVEFVVAWLVWFVIWGRRWRRSTQLWATAGIGAAVLLALGVGMAS